MRKIYVVLTLVGIVLPFSQLIRWLIEYGINIELFIKQILENPVAAFAWLDVVVTVIVITFMIINEGKKLKMTSLWIPIAALFIGGASVGLPLFLYMRQYHLDKIQRTLS
nr:DUF2834 domain-containing protein [uncultured Acinetobacter sp.]